MKAKAKNLFIVTAPSLAASQQRFQLNLRPENDLVDDWVESKGIVESMLFENRIQDNQLWNQSAPHTKYLFEFRCAPAMYAVRHFKVFV